MKGLLTVIGMLAAAAPGSQGASPVAFRDARSKPAVPSELQDRSVLRIRPAVLNSTLFDASAANKLNRNKKRDPSASSIVVMNFFPDAILRAHWTSAEKNEQGALVWTGSVEGSRFGQAVLVVTGSSVVGNITRGDGRLYQIRTTENRTLWIREIDQSRFPAEGQPK